MKDYVQMDVRMGKGLVWPRRTSWFARFSFLLMLPSSTMTSFGLGSSTLTWGGWGSLLGALAGLGEPC